MTASRLIFTLLLVSSAAVVQLAGQQTNADQKPLEEVKAKVEAGEAESQVELGRCYEKGQGVAKDLVEAAKWHRKAAEQNVAVAQNNLDCELRIMTIPMSQCQRDGLGNSSLAALFVILAFERKKWPWEKDGAISPGLCFLNDYFR